MLVLINDKNLGFEDKSTEFFPEVDSYVFDFQFSDFNQDGNTDIYFCNFWGRDILLFGKNE